jgi:murein DD-endopeptidase MepM/ murein hydrolase activator NlpD
MSNLKADTDPAATPLDRRLETRRAQSPYRGDAGLMLNQLRGHSASSANSASNCSDKANSRQYSTKSLSFARCSKGQVVKMRLGLGWALGLGTVLVCVLFALTLVATDYGRLHFSSYLTRIYLSRVSDQVAALYAENRSLQADLISLNKQNAEIVRYKAKVEQRLKLLSSVIGSATPLDPFEKEKRLSSNVSTQLRESQLPQSGSQNRDFVNGVGGAEVEVANYSRSKSKSVNPDKETLGSRLKRLFGQHQNLSDNELLIELDRHVEVVRRLPLASPGIGWVSSGFGHRSSPFTGRVSKHEGLDLLLPHDSSVMSSADGEVLEVERHPTYGLTILIEHTPRIQTRYAHLIKALVKPGDSVCMGETLGLSGSSGRSTGPHLHYEILVDGVATDPLKFMQVLDKLVPLDLSILK